MFGPEIPGRSYRSDDGAQRPNPVTKRLSEQRPAWVDVLEMIPPAESLVRTVPTMHHPQNPRLKKPRRTYRPQRMVYEEDTLRQTFFRDHPWELARPRILVETDGLDARRFDWSKGLVQPGMPVCGESVVQRQMWMMGQGMTCDQAYDAARREFYDLRYQEDVERRIAREEATMVGAYFGRDALAAGMRQEDYHYETWKRWAQKQTASMEDMRLNAYVDFSQGEGDDAEAESIA